MMAMRDRHTELSELGSLLLFVQGAIALSLTAEAVGGALLLGGGIVGAVLSGVGAVVTFVLAWGVGQRRMRSLRWARRLQYGWLATGVVDMGLSVVLAGIGPSPTPFLTRILLPASIIVVLRRLRAVAAVPAAGMEVAA